MKACCPKVGCVTYAQGWGHEQCMNCCHRTGGAFVAGERVDNYRPRSR